MIVDTSAWIEFLRGTGSPVDLLLGGAMAQNLPLYTPAVVVQEVLQGASSPANFMALQREMEQLEIYEPQDWLMLHTQAAMLYARCRWQGVTVRSPMDCVVAACAIESGLPLLGRDHDFRAMARVEPALALLP
jgi:predicted nucleic acid-binding protein